MNFLANLMVKIKNDQDALNFFQHEVIRQNKIILCLERKVRIAYSFGYEDCHKGASFDKTFKAEYIDF